MRGRTDSRVVLAYAGSLASSVAIGWLAETCRAEVVTVTLDLGQDAHLDAVRDRALASGARRAHVIDAREEFARDVVVPALRAGAIGSDGDPLARALSRPVIARNLMLVAGLEEAGSVAHGAADHQDRRRFDSLLADLDPSRRVLAPVADWPLGRDEVTARARMMGLSVPRRPKTAGDANLWGRTVERPAPGADCCYVLTRSPADAPDLPAHVEISFEEGVPVAVNGVALSLVELIASLETIAGAHGVGRVHLSGTPEAPAIEAPAAIVLHDARRALERAVTARPPGAGAAYADLVSRGAWFSTAREDADAGLARALGPLTGTARLRLFKGQSDVVECRSPFALSQPDSPSMADAAARS